MTAVTAAATVTPVTVGERVAFFLPNLGGGGAERAMLNLSAELTALGHRVDLILAKAEGELLPEVPTSVQVVDLGQKRLFSAVWPLLRYLRRARPQALLSTLEHANVLALAIAPFVRPTRVVIREANTVSLDANAGSLRGRVLLAVMRLLYPRARAAVAVSQGVAQELQARLGVRPERIHVIANPVLVPRVFQQAKERPDHPWFGGDGPPVVLGVGRLAQQKGFDVLLRAFAQVRQAIEARLVILGEGPLRPELEALRDELGLTTAVQLPGFKPNPFAYMARADAFILSSRWEGLPNVLIQAMAVGAPAVATDCRSGPNEILEGGRYGHLVPVDDVPAMAEAILATLRGNRPTVPPAWADQYRAREVAEAYAGVLGLRGPA